MMLYRVLRRLARLALTWYYADVMVQGRERVPTHGPVLLVANHPNALVDAMLVAANVPRRVLFTAKATLFEQPALAALLHATGVVPLRRAKDEQPAATGAPAATRNADAFRAVTTALEQGGAVLVFPEGISHDAPTLAPLRTGAARMALMAHAAGVTGLRLVAVGLTYEAKERLRSRVLVRFGEPVDLDLWVAENGASAPALTTALDARLRDVTLNFATEERAHRVVQLARSLSAITGEVPPLDRPRALAVEADLARRIDAAGEALASAPDVVVRRADELVAATEAFERRLAAHGVALSELRVSPSATAGAWFVFRESLFLTLALPVALVDRLAHDMPVRIARTVALRSLVDDPSRDQPAMRTIVLAAGMLIAWYLVVGVTLGRWVGWSVALLALATMALSARVELSLRDRQARARRRARTFLALRADPAFRTEALDEARRLLEGANALEQALLTAHDARAPDAR